MHITALGHVISLKAPVATAVTLFVLCGSTSAQPTNAMPEPRSTLLNAISTSQLGSEETVDSREPKSASDEIDSPAIEESTQQRLRPVGAGGNGAPRYIRSDAETAPWQSFAGWQSASGHRAEVSEISSRWWFSTGLTDVGFGVGNVALTMQPMSVAAVNAADVGIVLTSSASLSVGIRRRTSATTTVYADATRARSIGVSGIDSYSGKVGVEWKAAESRWSVAYSGLGMRLSSESRMTVSLRKGGLGIYMRSQF